MHTLPPLHILQKTDVQSWGQDVIDMVNNNLHMTMTYCGAPESQTIDDGIAIDRQEHVVDLNGTSQLKRQSSPKQILPEIYLPEIYRSTSSGMKAQRSCDFRAPCMHPQYHYQGHRQCRLLRRSTSTLRLPDFFKRVFPPPSCLYPECDLASEMTFDIDESLKRDTITRALFERRRGSDRIRYCAARPRSSGRRSKAFCSTPRSSVEPLQAKEYQLCTRNWLAAPEVSSIEGGGCFRPLQDCPGRVYAADMGPRCLRWSKRASSIYSPTHSVDAGQINCDNEASFKASATAHATAQASLTQSQIDRDIEAFLNTSPCLETLNARQILDLCEAAAEIDTLLAPTTPVTSPSRRLNRRSRRVRKSMRQSTSSSTL